MSSRPVLSDACWAPSGKCLRGKGTPDRIVGNQIGVARGCSGCTCKPRAEKKIWRNLQGNLQVHPSKRSAPSGSARVNFHNVFWRFRGRTRSGSFNSFRSSFEGDEVVKSFEEKVHPRQNPGYAYVGNTWRRLDLFLAASELNLVVAAVLRDSVCAVSLLPCIML